MARLRQPGAERLKFGKFGPHMTTGWFLQDQLTGSSAIRVCILNQVGLLRVLQLDGCFKG